MKWIAIAWLLVACGTKDDARPKDPSGATAKLDKLTVTADGAPFTIEHAYVRRSSTDAWVVVLGAGAYSCDTLRAGADPGKSIAFTIAKRVAPTGAESYLITELWSRSFDAKLAQPAPVTLTGNADLGTPVTIDLGSITAGKVALAGSLTAVGCGEVAPSGLGTPKVAHASKATILIAGKKVHVVGTTVRARTGVAATDLPNIRISAGPLDCSEVVLPAPVMLERVDGTWTLKGTWFDKPLVADDGATLAFSANDVGKSADGPTLTLQLSGKGTFGGYTVELFDTVDAVECVH